MHFGKYQVNSLASVIDPIVLDRSKEEPRLKASCQLAFNTAQVRSKMITEHHSHHVRNTTCPGTVFLLSTSCLRHTPPSRLLSWTDIHVHAVCCSRQTHTSTLSAALDRHTPPRCLLLYIDTHLNVVCCTV